MTLAELDTVPFLRILGQSRPVELFRAKDPRAGAMAHSVKFLNSVRVSLVIFQVLPHAGTLPLGLKLLFAYHVVPLFSDAVKILRAVVHLDYLQELALIFFRVECHFVIITHPWNITVQQLAASGSYDIHIALLGRYLRQF